MGGVVGASRIGALCGPWLAAAGWVACLSWRSRSAAIVASAYSRMIRTAAVG